MSVGRGASRWWKEVMSLDEASVGLKVSWLSDNLVWKVGRGNQMRFGGTFGWGMILFVLGTLFNVALDKECRIAEKGDIGLEACGMGMEVA